MLHVMAFSYSLAYRISKSAVASLNDELIARGAHDGSSSILCAASALGANERDKRI